MDVISGRQFERPGLSELIDHARPGDSLCVTRLDRLGVPSRNYLRLSRTKGRDIHLVSFGERINTTWAAGELVFHVFGEIAYFERRLISERTRDGIAAARKPGRSTGRRSQSRAHPHRGRLTPGQAAKQVGINRATAYRIVKAPR